MREQPPLRTARRRRLYWPLPPPRQPDGESGTITFAGGHQVNRGRSLFRRHGATGEAEDRAPVCLPHIPLELWVIIANFGLNAYDLVAMSAVSREWYRIAHVLASHLPSAARLIGVRRPAGSSIRFASPGPVRARQPYHTAQPFHYLTCWDLDAVLDLSGCSELMNVEALAGIHTLNLADCLNLSDVSCLGNVYDLNLSVCPNVSDVRALGGVHKLQLAYCRSLANVSALGRVHWLNLSYCRQVVDVEGLGTVHTLILTGCQNLVDVGSLGAVHTLTLADCPKVSDVSALGGVHTLCLRGCRSVVDVSALGTVHFLDLRLCLAVVDAEALLGRVKLLWL
jgi:hypothetical protein